MASALSSRTPPEILTALASAGLLAALTVAGRAGRDSFFLSEFPASHLPRVVMGAAILSIGGAVAMSRLASRVPPARLVPIAFGVSAVLFVAEWLLALSASRFAAVAVYLHVSAIAPLIASGFWAVISERFDPYTAKRTVARMAATGALAGVVGGLVAERTAAWLGLPALLPVLATLSVLAAVGVMRIGGPDQPPAAPPPDAASGLRALSRTPLLRQMATLMVFVAIVEILVDYAFKVEAAASFDSGALIRFFAIFYTSTGLLSFAFQAAIGTRVLQRFGLGGAIALLPLAVALFASLAAGVGRLWAFVLARGAETVGWNSFFRSGFELLYTPVPPHVRRPAKAWVDVASRSSGDIIGAAALLALLGLLPDLPSTVVVGLAAVCCAASLLLVARIHRSYVAQLTESLRSGRVEMQIDQALDATTAHVLTESRASLDRSDLLERVREHHATRLADESADAALERDSSAGQAAGDRSGAPDPALGRIEDLCSGDARRIRRALHGRAESAGSGGALRSSVLERRLVSHAIPLLGRSDVADEIQGFLRRVAPRATGQLVDALLDPDEPVAVRVAVARVLSSGAKRRAVAGLWQGLETESFDVRAASARAVVRIVGQRPELSLGVDAVHARVERELSVADEEWGTQGQRAAGTDPAGSSVLLDGRALRQVSRSLEHVFTLLAVAHGREVMASTLAALTSGNDRLRGTALEFLETTLPPGPRSILWRRLEVSERRPTTERSQQQIAEELLRTTSAVLIDRDLLRADGKTPSG